MNTYRERNLKGLLARSVITIGLACAATAVAEDYRESVSGDLSNDPLQPTSIAIDEGDNRVRGQTIDNPTDPDFFTLVVPPGLEITGLSLSEFVLVTNMSDGGALIALEAGSQITDVNSSDNLVGFVIAGEASGTRVGDELLDDLGGSPLGPGNWTFWIQNTGSVTEYELTALAQPLAGPAPGGNGAVGIPTLGPTGLLLLIGAMLWMGARQRARRF